MPKQEELYVANLAFLLDYEDGQSEDEIEYEIFKIAFQDVETVHYDRQMGGNFRDLEQESSNGDISIVLKFITNIIQSIFFVNQEKNNEPYILVGYNDIAVNNDPLLKEEEYLVDIKYKLLNDMTVQGKVTI